MQTPPNLNDQQTWGGQRYQPVSRALPTIPKALSTPSTASDDNDRTALNAHRQQDGPAQASSQAGFIASSSDNLFHPVPNVQPSYVFSLPKIPSNPRLHNQNPTNTFQRPFPYRSNLSSYNNPRFEVPPAPLHHPSSINVQLGPGPPIPPRIRSSHSSHVSQPQNNHSPHAYNHSPHAYNHTQPVYNHSQPAYNHVPPIQPPYYTQPLPNTFLHQNLPAHALPLPSSSLPAHVLPLPSSLPVTCSASKTLPTVTHISILTSKLDFFAWDEGVTSLLRANNLIGHILEPSTYVDPARPDLVPIPPPVLSTVSTASEIDASNRWWANDNIAQHILISRLGSVPRGLLPASNITTRTALSIYKLLLQYYGTSNFADCTELLTSLHNSVCTTGRVQEFVSKWRTGLSKLQSARYDFNIKICISVFVRGLPNIPAFNTLRADLSRRIAAVMDVHDYGAFIELTETVLELDTIFRPTAQSQTSRTPRAPPIATPSVPVTSLSSTAVPDPTSRVPKKELTCGNCKSRGLRCVGHTDGTCFQPGGGMEGRRDEYMNNKSRVHAMFAECLENAFSHSEQSIHSDPPSLPTSPLIPSTPDDDILLPPIANLCISDFPVNSDILRDLYIRCDEFQCPLAFTSTNQQTVALLSMGHMFNALLDSGCTHHIIRDLALFRNYVERPVSVGTANCGSLDALGSGDVEFRYPFKDRHVLFTLRGCLYAPSAPINLLSVGALVERGMSCLFSPGGITKISYPADHAVLPGLSFSATVSNRLSFLKLDFIAPLVTVHTSASTAGTAGLHKISAPLSVLATSSPISLSASSFPRVKLDSMLWHRRFGHIGMDATRAALTKNYVTGVKLDGSFIRDHCISCIVGKSPQKSYALRGNRAKQIGELLHMDLCGPFPVQAPRGEKYFFNILDDKSNWGFTIGLRLKSDAFSFYRSTEAFLERSANATVLNVRCGGELELTAGKMGEHFTSKGITVQRTVPYAHQQNGKSERYIRTIEEGSQALLADTGLPMSFWLDAVLTRQYLVNRLPTSTLPDDLTPFELITNGRKPDLSHLRVWGCECYVAIPDELRPKAGSKRFRAIFVGYEEHRIGWRVRDLHGKYSFSNDVIFNESLSGRLGLPRSLSTTPADSLPPSDSPLRPVRTHPRIRTDAGQAYDEVLRLKEFRRAERENRRVLVNNVVDGGVDALSLVGTYGGVTGDVLSVVDGTYGGATGDELSVVDVYGGAARADDAVDNFGRLSPSLAVIDAFVSLIASSSLSDPIDTYSFSVAESDILWDHLTISTTSPAMALRAGPSLSHHPQSFDLSKPPFSYTEAIARPDALAWRAAMDRELQSLRDMNAFEEADLPRGEKTIGLKWVYDYKTDAFGNNIPGKEKARLVAQGFNQRPGQYDETYAPVAKMASVRILLTWAAVHDLEIFQFDCKTAFLHAKLRHTVFARPFPGLPTSDPSKVLRILAALYGLRQSAYEFYILIMSLLLDLGMVRCDVDHGVFIGEWTSPPDISIVMPSSGVLILYVPLHVDDGLGITNSQPLYIWFLKTLSQRLHVVDLGHCSKFLNILIIRDRINRKIWLSSRLYVLELLEEWNLTSCKPASTPFPSSAPISSLNSLPELSDADLVPRYQRLVGCLLYLAISTRPDISFYAMWLGQYNASPTRAHFLAAKHVLRYLAGTKELALCLGASSPRVPSTLSGYLQNVGCSDADWASDAVDRKSISGYSFYFQGSLISWSAVKQKSIALSSTEAEYYAMTHAFKEALWLRTFLTILKFPVPRPFPILSDNQAACSLSNSPAISARSKHIDIRHHFIRDHVQAGSFSTTWIPTEDMPSDIFTKSLPLPVFSRHRDVLSLSIPPSLV